MDISAVIPVYNEEESLPELHAWIKRVMDDHAFTYEILFIDDGSKDRSWEIVKSLAQENPEVHGFKFSKNYGKTAALQTGFNEAKGKVVITLDADLQDSPDEIPELYRMITEDGYDLVSGWKEKRYDPITKTIPTKLFNATTRIIHDIDLHDMNCGLKAYNSKVTKNIVIYGEMHRYIPVVAKWNGFTKIGEKVVQHQARKYGHTKFGIERFLNGFLDLLSITFVNKFGKSPMHFFGLFGVLAFLGGLAIAAFLMGEKLYSIYSHQPYRNVTDNPLFFLGLTAAVIGSQMFLAGFLGELFVRNNISKDDYVVAERV
jgi:glycosyltransferase involved in cell wall biosynthesis